MIPSPFTPGSDKAPLVIIIISMIFYPLFVVACLLLIFNRPLLDKTLGFFGL